MPYNDTEYKFKKIGKNVVIGKNVYIRYPEETEIGDNVIIDEFCCFTTKLRIGSYIHIGPHCSVIGGSNALFVMQDFSGLSAGCRIICASDDYLGSGLTNPTIPEFVRATVTYGSVVLEKHSVVGTNTVVHPGVTVRVGCAIGSCSLVNHDTEPWSIYLGVPAKKVKDRPSEAIIAKEKELLCK